MNRLETPWQQWAMSRPDSPAVFEKGKQIATYGELAKAAEEIAARLGGPTSVSNRLVAVDVSKSAAFLACVWGIWSAHQTFLPLAEDLPTARKTGFLEHGRPRVVIREVEEGQGGHICLGRYLRIDPFAPDFERPELDETSAYVVYTSGSSGKPKAVHLRHQGPAMVIAQQIEAFGLSPADRCLFYLSTGFDASISDFACALSAGASLFIEDKEHLLPGPDFRNLLAERRISHADLPPALLAHLDGSTLPDTLKSVLYGGEIADPEAVRAWSQKLRLFCVYGPTEASICTSLIKTDGRPAAPIGKPLNGVVYSVRDEDGLAVETGEQGELWISGPVLAEGYLDDPELSDRRFVSANCQRWYRTGDLVFVDQTGSYHFCGRLDRTFKRFGKLICPEEIEAHLTRLPDTTAGLVWKTTRGALVAVIEQDKAIPDQQNIKQILARELPAWMVPDHILSCRRIPRNNNGKIDAESTRELFAASLKNTEEADLLRDLWTSLGGGVFDGSRTFFELGGNSMTALRFAAELRRAGYDIQVADFYKAPHFQDLQQRLRDGKRPNQETTRLTPRLRALVSEIQIETPPPNATKPVYTLITGVTGQLGSALLAELLKTGHRHFILPVRAEDQESVKKRVFALFQHKPELNALLTQASCRYLPADIRLPRLGIEATIIRSLRGKVARVIHLAAVIDHFKNLEQLWPDNVLGTAHTVDLALSLKAPFFHYASTLWHIIDHQKAHPEQYLEESTVPRLIDGYGRGKWASEFILQSCRHGFRGSGCYRFGLLIGENPSARDHLRFGFDCLRKHTPKPRADNPKAMDFLPLHKAVTLFANLIADVESETQHAVFHLCAKEPLPYQHWYQTMADADLLPAKNQTPRSNPLASLFLETFHHDPSPEAEALNLFPLKKVGFDTSQTRTRLQKRGLDLPSPSQDEVLKLLKTMAQEQIPAPKEVAV